ncbi:hypothetical protein KBB96_08415 [Luteolibacter ambystomatis]|uniref:Lipoprotein n=1 Tax=Luteolibacter ambystomatis TaxID=2824561 RepID=A0A975PH27_9BACT|nr:hypothetical protein [Luteolibacter ambystomatis]QUE52902.1 hypothetical protein KBB96_08415 [Luteolibacter ambystomatis]
MKILSLFVGVPLVLTVVSCAPSADVQARRILTGDPHWPLVLADAQRTIRHREQQDFWAANARYTPYSYDGRVWVIRVSGAYPVDIWSDFIDLRMRNDGTVLDYAPSQQHESMVSGR